MLGCVFAIAQDKTVTTEKSNFLIITAGPSFPFGDFSSSNMDNEDAGGAKNGYNIELKFGHNFDNIFGLSAAAAYSSIPVHKSSFAEYGPDISVDPWQYFSILVGPRVTGTLSPKTFFDFSVLSGAAFVNSPKITYQNETVADKDEATAVPLKLAADLRFRLNNTGYLFGGVNYIYMKPDFTVISLFPTEPQTVEFKQKMSIVNVNLGIGFSF